MGDANDNTKNTGTPSWQQSIATSNTPAEPLPHEHNEDSSLETARRFLEDDQVRDASMEDKEKFLETKGLSKHIIKQLTQPSSSNAVVASNTTTTQTPIPSTPSPSSPSFQAPQPMSSAPRVVSTTLTTKDSPTSRQTPPIITYPEFLTTPPQPAPLITAKRLLTTLYLFGGLSALLYGTSTHIIAPLVESLTESRHDLAVTAQTKLDKLIAKLEGVVSTVPAPAHTTSIPYRDETDSDSDPTELFHRDIGIQTSPFSSRPASPSPELSKTSVVDTQTTRLSELSTHLQTLRQNSQSEGEDYVELTTTLDVVREYVQSLAFSSTTYGSTFNGYPGLEKEENNDEISKMKAQIRAVKGSLLSARSFPSSATRR